MPRAEAEKLQEKPGTGRGEGTARGRRPRLERRPRLDRRRTGEGERRERESRERKRFNWFKFEIFSKISFETWKTLNMKVVENFEFYTFRFRHKFV